MPTRNRRLWRVPLTVAMLVASLVVLAGPASAETVVVVDPRGDQRPRSIPYDIYRVRVIHKDERVRMELNQEATPYWYNIRVDVPGGKRWDYVVTWTAYYPRIVTVQTRRQFENHPAQETCQVPTARDPRQGLNLSFKRSCLGSPSEIRASARGYDDEVGEIDRTGWTGWASVG